jgi:uncharacterized protein YeeX (DUF496 family)
VVDAASEVHFEFDTTPRKFIDLETGEEVSVFAEGIKEEYEHSVTDYFKKIALSCAQNKIKYVAVNVGSDFEKIITSYLIEKQSFV